MNYSSIHDSIISRASNRIYDSSIHQNHHIIPICEDQNSTKVVPLTHKEHRIVHLLRYRMGKHIGNKKAYYFMKGKSSVITTEDFLKISSAAGKKGGKSTKENKSGIFSDDWDRSTETKRRHNDGIIIAYLKNNPEAASIAGIASVKAQKGIHSPEYDYSTAGILLWKSGKMNHIIPMLQNNAKLGGDTAYANKAGFHGLDKETQLKNSSKGGKVSGKMLHWNNGIINKKANECPGNGWYRGRMELIEKWFNNGIEQKLCKRCPSGWVSGMLNCNDIDKMEI